MATLHISRILDKKEELIMSKKCKIKSVVVVAILLASLVLVPMVGADTHEFKISIENSKTHPKTKGLEIFVEELIKRSDGRLKPELYISAQLYKDSHVTKAVSMGSVQMAVVGNYLLDGFDINATLTHLPMFFGQSQQNTMDLIDGEVGKFVSDKLEEKLNVEVIGKVFEMGFDNCYTIEKKIMKLEDFKGLRIRHAGGAVYTKLLKALGAEGVVISWPDVPMALARGTIDGLATTTKSAESAKLNESGLKYGVECHNHVSYYFPLVNRKFWNSLPSDLQKVFIEVWNETVPKQRKIARKQQIQAKIFLQGKGMEFYEPSAEKLAKWREHIMYTQDGLVKDLGYDPQLVKLAMKTLGM
jgi:TRAP-type C4-dicarboxylate transport system substrate-binding protein